MCCLAYGVRCLLFVVCSSLASLCYSMCVFAMCIDVRSVLCVVSRVVRVVRRFAFCLSFVWCWLMCVVGCCLMCAVCCVVLISCCC